jgi:hypothetical protein
MQPSGCPCYSSEGRSERRSLDPPLGGRPGDATTSVAGEKCAGATLHRARQWRRNFFRFNFIRELLAHSGLHCGIRHCFADSCLHEAYLPGCDLRDATAMPSPPCALFVCASACPARSRQAGFSSRVSASSARCSGRAHNYLRARAAAADMHHVSRGQKPAPGPCSHFVVLEVFGAGEGARTLDPDLGKVALASRDRTLTMQKLEGH